MSSAKVVFNFKGFDTLIDDIQRAGGSVNKSVDSAMKAAAQVQYKELKTQMHKAKVASDLINRMPAPKVEWQANKCTAFVGYEKGHYDPADLSDGYKALFINYGTPRRKPTQIKARGFIQKAKKAARPQIKKAQKQALEKILERTGLN